VGVRSPPCVAPCDIVSPPLHPPTSGRGGPRVVHGPKRAPNSHGSIAYNLACEECGLLLTAGPFWGVLLLKNRLVRLLRPWAPAPVLSPPAPGFLMCGGAGWPRRGRISQGMPLAGSIRNACSCAVGHCVDLGTGTPPRCPRLFGPVDPPNAVKTQACGIPLFFFCNYIPGRIYRASHRSAPCPPSDEPGDAAGYAESIGTAPAVAAQEPEFSPFIRPRKSRLRMRVFLPMAEFRRPVNSTGPPSNPAGGAVCGDGTSRRHSVPEGFSASCCRPAKVPPRPAPARQPLSLPPWSPGDPSSAPSPPVPRLNQQRPAELP